MMDVYDNFTVFMLLMFENAHHVTLHQCYLSMVTSASLQVTLLRFILIGLPMCPSYGYYGSVE